MSNRLQPFVVILLASIATRLWNPISNLNTTDFSLAIGWLQCINANNNAHSCFCCDGNVRLFKHNTMLHIAEVDATRITNASVPLNVSSHGVVYQVYSEVEANMRLPNENYKWVLLTGESAACIKICDQKSVKFY